MAASLHIQYAEIVTVWLEKYIKKLHELTRQYKKVFVLGISRKMPRFLYWIENEFLDKDDSLKCEYHRIMDKIEFTTEIAIPFIFKNHLKKNNNDIAVLVIDDTVIMGNTMRVTSAAVEEYIGKKPIAMPIVSLRNYTQSQLGVSEVIYSTIIPDDAKLQDWLAFVCKSNQSASLPIDVEFPIVYPNKDFEYMQRALRSIENNDQYNISTYSIPDDLSQENGGHEINNILKSFNLVDLSQSMRDYKVDFRKLRLFDANKTKLIIFAPCFLLASDMLDSGIFKQPMLRAAWTLILNEINGTTNDKNRFYQTLAVCLNYLFSLSTLNKISRDIGPDYEFGFSLEIDDLKLIFGYEFAKIIIINLTAILDLKESEILPLGRCKLPSILAPNEFMANYEMRRELIMLDHRGCPADSVLDEIFVMSGAFDGLFSKYGTLFHRMHSYFYETFDSLNELFRNEIGSQEECIINKWIDSRIDMGIVVPRYVEVTSNYGEKYWRRYFMNNNSCL